MNKYLSIITLNVNELNAPIKRHRIAEWIKKHNPQRCCLQETHLRTKDILRQKVKGQKKIFQANKHKKKAGLAILISGKIDFKTKAIKRDKEGHYIKLKVVVQQDNITIIYINAPNIGTPKYIKKILEDFKKDIGNNTIIVGDFNTLLSTMDRSSKQNINKGIETLDDTLEQIDLIDIYRSFPKTKQSIHTFQMHMEYFQK